jgi:hypothetical protein
LAKKVAQKKIINRLYRLFANEAWAKLYTAKVSQSRKKEKSK